MCNICSRRRPSRSSRSKGSWCTEEGFFDRGSQSSFKAENDQPLSSPARFTVRSLHANRSFPARTFMPVSLPPLTSHFAPLAADYDVVLCDVWGVVHNGVAASRESCDALAQF